MMGLDLPLPLAGISKGHSAARAILGLTVAAALAAPASWAISAGTVAPEIAATRAGADVTLQSMRGQWVYLDFWASWCGPCKQSFPWMNEMHTRYAPLGLRIVAINVDSRAADAERFLTTTPALFAVAYDAKGETPKRFELKAMPTSYLIDPNGRVALVHSGFRDGDRAELEAVLARVLKKGGTP